MKYVIDIKSGINKRKTPIWLKVLNPIAIAIYIYFGLQELKNDHLLLGIGFVLAAAFHVFNLFPEKEALVVFEENGIYFPSQNIFPKQKFLPYKEISEAKYLVGDFVFRNKDQEIRLVKEFLDKEDIAFLQQKLVDLNAIK